MARFVNPITDLKALGSIRFFKAGTDSPLTTFADDLESIPNPAQIDVDANGNLPNIFFSGSARVKYLDEFGQQYNARDPVGGDRELGDFTLWDTQVIYDLNDIVERTNKFYKSLSNANQSNDPVLVLDKWEEIRFIGVYNINITYVIGDIVQTVDGNLWKSLIAVNLNNDPSTDTGVNWISAMDGQWINKSSAFPIIAGKKYQIDASGGAVDAPFEPSYLVGDVIIVHNESISTNLVRLTNSTLTIKGAGDTVTSSDNLVLEPGDTAHLVAKTTTILEVV